MVFNGTLPTEGEVNRLLFSFYVRLPLFLNHFYSVHVGPLHPLYLISR